jgi:YHS domain-containing protein
MPAPGECGCARTDGLAARGRGLAKDPVCDMLVDVATAKLTSAYHGEQVYFCAVGCKLDFDEDPERYLVQSLRWRAPGKPLAMRP